MKDLKNYAKISRNTQAVWNDQSKQLLNSLSEEFKAPLMAIENNAFIMEEMIEDNNYDQLKMYGKYINGIVGESKKLTNIIDDVIYFFNLAKTEDKLQFSKLSVNDMVKELIVGFENYYPFKKFNLKIAKEYLEVDVNKEMFLEGLKRLISLVLEVSDGIHPEVAFKVNRGILNIDVTAPNFELAPSQADAVFEPLNALANKGKSKLLSVRLGLIKRLFELNHAQIHIDYREDNLVVFNLQVAIRHQDLKVAS